MPGHWEGDLVVGGDMRSCLITLVECSTRFVLVRRLEMHPADLVARELAGMARDIPDALVRAIAWDQGMGMARHADLTDATGVKACSCDSRSPWQRGTSESANGLIRDCFPKGTNFSKVTDKEVRGIAGPAQRQATSDARLEEASRCLCRAIGQSGMRRIHRLRPPRPNCAFGVPRYQAWPSVAALSAGPGRMLGIVASASVDQERGARQRRAAPRFGRHAPWALSCMRSRP